MCNLGFLKYAVFLFLFVPNNGNKFRLGLYYQPEMVLQSGGANIWGWGGPHADVQIKSGNSTLASTKVDGEGRWQTKVVLQPGGPYNLTLVHRWLSLPNKIQLSVLAGEVWLCAGSDNMAMPMAGVMNATHELETSLNFTQVRYTEVNKAWAEEPQLDLIGGLSIPWQAPNKDTLPLFSSTCWMFGRELFKRRKIPVGLVGIYVNQTDLWPWTDGYVVKDCGASSMQHVDERGHFNAMLFPFFNSSAKGGILYEGQVDVEKGDNLTHHGCMLNGTISKWMSLQNLSKLALVSLGNNENTTYQNNQSWPQLRWIQANTISHIPNTILVPSHDLQDPGQRLSRHKLDLAERLVNMTASPFDQSPVPPSIAKACYVYIYISLTMTEEVTEMPGYPENGFRSCCRDTASSNESCFSTGPNGDIDVLNAVEGNNNTKDFLFARECHVGNSTGLVTEIYYGWNGGYPYMQAPLYGAYSKLPASSSFVKVVHDLHDPNCVHQP